MRGHLSAASAEFEQAVVTFAGFDSHTESERTLLLLADVAHHDHDPDREIEFLYAAQQLHVAYGQDPDPVIQQRLDALRGSA